MNPMPTNGRPNFNLLTTQSFDFIVREATCVAVIDRDTGRWLGSHVALGCTMSLVQTVDQGRSARWEVQISDRRRDLRLGPLLGLEKPSEAVVRHLLREPARPAA